MPKGSAVCLLSGTFNNYYDIERTRDIIKSIRESINLKVVWARPTESPSTKLGVGEDIIVTAQHSEMPKLISQSHFGIAILKETKPEILAATAPTKVAEFLASGRPMIVSKGIGDLDFLLMKYNSGLVIEESQPTDDIGAQISGLIMDPDVVERCRKLSIDHFDMSNAIRIYSEIYKRMLKESK
jgi:glycosyltransferase involved in cell wall biosynthesis